MIKVRADKFYCSKQLKMGIKVEMEHTNSLTIAKRIAKQHLEEHSKYYTYLAIMEKKLKKIKQKEMKKKGMKKK